MARKRSTAARTFEVGQHLMYHHEDGTQWAVEVIYPGPGTRTVVTFLADCAEALLPYGLRTFSAANHDLTF